MARAGYWNHNVQYQPVILGAVPPGCGSALEVGCGDGMLAGRLAERSADVTGIDRDRRMIALARSQFGEDARVRFIEADFLAHDFPAASFDFACANTSLHHIDFGAALTAMVRVPRPGGRLAVIGLAADKSIADRLAGAPGVPADRERACTDGCDGRRNRVGHGAAGAGQSSVSETRGGARDRRGRPRGDRADRAGDCRRHARRR